MGLRTLWCALTCANAAATTAAHEVAKTTTSRTRFLFIAGLEGTGHHALSNAPGAARDPNVETHLIRARRGAGVLLNILPKFRRRSGPDRPSGGRGVAATRL